jgi:hypothetical protein
MCRWVRIQEFVANPGKLFLGLTYLTPIFPTPAFPFPFLTTTTPPIVVESHSFYFHRDCRAWFYYAFKGYQKDTAEGEIAAH